MSRVAPRLAQKGVFTVDRTIVVIVGSLSAQSLNRRLAQALARMAPPGYRFEWMELGDLPLFNRDAEHQPCAAVARIKAQVAQADGLLFVTPEHNRSIPAALKNAIDHGSRPSGQSVWFDKPGAIIGASPAPAGTAVAQQHLRAILSAQGVVLMAGPDRCVQCDEASFTPEGELAEALRPRLHKWLHAFVQWVHKQGQA
ncbi:NAD(P)H-dependent oxidoreductase [Allofranklinella schreckenbergeri]|uniref:NAD(P)H-dependent oxidoreductase n=1 Tax=Allofranklinella schreckenbergeri TaxID=1076744 RepID=A0A3M6Q5S8_9BURK|nr:NAD(P)H-dependent oxidoreductase [Allofranklinella schreckenbergeri]